MAVLALRVDIRLVERVRGSTGAAFWTGVATFDGEGERMGEGERIIGLRVDFW